MIPFNSLTCLFIAVAIAWIMRQLCSRPKSEGERGLVIRASMAMVAVPYALKAYQRISGDPPTLLDITRDLGLLLMFIAVIISNHKRFGRL